MKKMKEALKKVDVDRLLAGMALSFREGTGG